MLTSTAWCWLRAEKTKKNCQKKSKKSEIVLTKLKKCHKLKRKKKDTNCVRKKVCLTQPYYCYMSKYCSKMHYIQFLSLMFIK